MEGLRKSDAQGGLLKGMSPFCEPPPPAFSGPPSNFAKRFRISLSY